MEEKGGARWKFMTLNDLEVEWEEMKTGCIKLSTKKSYFKDYITRKVTCSEISNQFEIIIAYDK